MQHAAANFTWQQLWLTHAKYNSYSNIKIFLPLSFTHYRNANFDFNKRTSLIILPFYACQYFWKPVRLNFLQKSNVILLFIPNTYMLHEKSQALLHYFNLGNRIAYVKTKFSKGWSRNDLMVILRGTVHQRYIHLKSNFLKSELYR